MIALFFIIPLQVNAKEAHAHTASVESELNGCKQTITRLQGELEQKEHSLSWHTNKLKVEADKAADLADQLAKTTLKLNQVCSHSLVPSWGRNVMHS